MRKIFLVFLLGLTGCGYSINIDKNTSGGSSYLKIQDKVTVVSTPTSENTSFRTNTLAVNTSNCNALKKTSGKRSVSDPKALDISGAIDVKVIHSDKNSLEWEGLTEQGKDLIVSESSGLTIYPPNGCSKDVHVTIRQTGNTNRITISGASKVKFDENTLAETLDTEISGASIVDTGIDNIPSLRLNLSGASEFTTNSVSTAEVEISGASEAKFNNLSKIQGDLSGVSHLRTGNSVNVSELEISGVSSVN
jgi:Putative auto-transporter adhesin, head GIN domain